MRANIMQQHEAQVFHAAERTEMVSTLGSCRVKHKELKGQFTSAHFTKDTKLLS